MVSRGYALGVLLGFGFARCKRAGPSGASGPGCCSACSPTPRCFGTIWSFGLGLFYALRNRQEWRLMLPGAALYAAAAALAVVTMLPAPDFTFGGQARAEFSQFDMPLHFAIGAFVPLFSLPLSAMCPRVRGSGWNLPPAHRSSRIRSVSCSRYSAGLGQSALPGSRARSAGCRLLHHRARCNEDGGIRAHLFRRASVRAALAISRSPASLRNIVRRLCGHGLDVAKHLAAAPRGAVAMGRAARHQRRRRSYDARPWSFAPSRKAAMPRPGSRPCTSKISSSWARRIGPRRRSQAISAAPLLSRL